MDANSFYKSILSAIGKLDQNEYALSSIQEFLEEIKIILDESEEDSFTKMTILFEGFYRSICEDSNLHKILLEVKLKRWEKHFGTPTLSFLLSYHNQIDAICDQFKKFPVTKKDSFQLDPFKKYEFDSDNAVIVNNSVMEEVAIPDHLEKTGEFIKTYNPIGGFTTTPCDPYSQKFLSYVAEIVNKNGKILEIGAAFGSATLKALALGATVFCNDVDPKNLAVVRKRYSRESSSSHHSVTGDENNLVLVPGSFPDELAGLPKNHFDAILICRVMHFFKGDKLVKSLKEMAALLKPGGKLFIVCETPFLKNWQRFIPEYEKRIREGMEWPGEISNPEEFESSGRTALLPKFVHWITKEIIDRSLIRTNFFAIEQSSYIDRRGQFPDDLLLDGRESVGAIAVRKM